MKKVYINIFLCLIFFLPACAFAQDYNAWVGFAGDHNWHNPLNWQNNRVPLASDIVYFDRGSSCCAGGGICNINQDVTVYGIILGNEFAGIITQNSGKFRVGYGGVKINGGSLILKTGSFRVWGDLIVDGGHLEDQLSYVISPEVADENCSPEFLYENLNYVRQQSVLVPIQNAALVENLPIGSKTVITEYYDGLGRPIETVARQASPSLADIIVVHEYDANGLETKRRLPYVSSTCSGMFMELPRAITQQQDYYNPVFNNDPLIASSATNPYQEIVYDNTPFKRVTEVAAQGSAWKVIKDATNTVSTQAGHTTLVFTRANLASEVLLWAYNHTNGSASAFTAGLPVFYPARTLFAKESIDENGLKTIQFVNNIGQLLLKRIVESTGNMDTYYIYDHFGQLTYIIPPEAAKMANLAVENYSITTAGSFTNRWLFCYTYDERHRVSTKKIPGSGVSSFVYDPLNRQVMSQTANQAATNQWLFVKYDVYGRLALSGLYTDVNTRTVIQSNINAGITPTSLYFESRTSAAGNLGYYSNTVFPTGITSASLMKLNYYDDYDFNYDNAHLADYSYTTSGLSPEPVPFLSNWGKATGSQTKIVGTNNWLTTVNFYDKFGRVIQAKSNNHLAVNAGNTNLNDLATIVYDFAGRITNSRQVHTPGVGTALPVTVDKRYTYDHMSRPLQSWQRVYTSQNPQALEVLITSLKYNKLGQPIEKNLHSEDNGITFLQSVDFRYNIRGWLNSINNSSLTNDGGVSNNDGNDLFGMNFNYETANTDLGSAPRFNGDITAARWKTNNPSGLNTLEQAYTYNYDTYGRLTDAFSSVKSTTWASSSGFNESGISYDLNGNIKTLNRRDKDAWIDQLAYSYTGNQLIKMTDTSGSASVTGFTSRSAAATQYTYDANGNLLTDANRQFSFTYNYLNLTLTATNTGTATPGTITYTYDATGTKLSQSVTPQGSSFTTVTHYVGNFIYDGNVLQSIMTPEGRLVPSGSGFNYEYTLKDQQGNARISFDKGTDGKARVIQENHYYAFGLKRENTYVFGSTNNFLYSGKELEGELNLNQYDYGFRQYDAVLGRWHCQDALADMYHNESPYQFVGNNPINWVDIMGLSRGDGQNGFYGNVGGNPNPGSQITGGIQSFNGGLLAEVVIKGSYTGGDAAPMYGYGSGTGNGSGNHSTMIVNSTVTINPNFNGPPSFSGYPVDPADGILILTEGDGQGESIKGNDEYDLDYVGNIIGAGGTAADGLENLIANNYWWVDSKGKYNFTKVLNKGANGKFVKGVQGLRNGYASALKSASAYKVLGNGLGVAGLAITAIQYKNGQISGTEASVDAAFGVIGFFGPVGAGISAAYFIGKIGYEYYSGSTMFEKPR